MPPRLPDDVLQERPPHFGEPDENGGVVPVVLGEKESLRIDLHQNVPIGDRLELEDEDRVVIAESREEPAVHEERGHPVGRAFDDPVELQDQLPGVGNGNAASVSHFRRIQTRQVSGPATSFGIASPASFRASLIWP